MRVHRLNCISTCPGDVGDYEQLAGRPAHIGLDRLVTAATAS